MTSGSSHRIALSDPVNAAVTRRRVLIIGAKDGVDFIRAGQLVRQFMGTDRQKYGTLPGRSHHVIYSTRGEDNAAAVWYTNTQVTVHFGDQEC